MSDGYFTNEMIDNIGESDWDSIREAEAILAGEIPSTPETRDQVRQWLGHDSSVNKTTGGHKNDHS